MQQEEHPAAKRNLRDSVFTNYFSELPHLRNLCAELLNDQTILEKDIEICTLDTVLTNGQYNDVGAWVRNRAVVVLTEEQTIWSINILLRMFCYLADTWQVMTSKRNLYSTVKVDVPFPELSVVCPSAPADLGNIIDLADHLFSGKKYAPHLYVHIVRDAPKESDLGQYL